MADISTIGVIEIAPGIEINRLSSARMTEVTQGKAADASIIAIVDAVEKDGQYVYQKASA